MNIQQKIYLDLEPHFVYDYIFFAARLRFLQSQENSYKKYEMKNKAKAMCLVNLFETYQKSIEDLSAVILSLYRRYNHVSKGCKYQKEFKSKETPLIYTLINYTPGEPRLKKILALFNNDAEIVRKLGITNIERINITLLYPSINFQNFYNFFIRGLKDLSDDQNRRLKMFNKIKHGGIIVADGANFSNNLDKHMPAAIYSDPKSFSPEDHPLVIHGFKYTEQEFELMKAGIMKVMVMIQVILSMYLCKEYGGVLKTMGLKSSLQIFNQIKMKKYISLWGGY